MKTRALLLCCAFTLTVAPLPGQSPFYPIPARVLGQAADPNNPGQSKSYSPNLVEGRELWGPQSVALDKTTGTPALYVADTLNNRVLGWRNALTAGGAAPADLVIGPPDASSTTPGTANGLNQPAAVTVDSRGNLWVIDSGNHRVLRFPKPFDAGSSRQPDVVLGQKDFSSRQPNQGGAGDVCSGGASTNCRNERTLSFSAGGSSTFPGALAFNASGDLFVTDPGNNRVLVYDKAIDLPSGAANVPANRVIGQDDFISATTTQPSQTRFDTMNRLWNPVALTIDQAGRIYIADRLNRVLVFAPNFPARGAGAIGRLGALNPQTGQTYQPPTNKSLLAPQGLTIIDTDLVVVDTGNNRILRFDPFSNWPALPDSAAAKAVIGQPGFTTSDAKPGPSNLSAPLHAAFSGSDLFVADYGNNRVIVFPAAGPTASRVLGQPNANVNGANIVDGKGLYLGGTISTYYGNTVAGGTVALDTRKTPLRMYVSDTFNNRVLGYCDVRKINPGDLPTLVIGQPNFESSAANYNPDGSTTANDSNLRGPTGLAVDANGNLYVADWGNGRVLRFPEPCANPGGTHRANLVLGQPNFTGTRVLTPGPAVMGEPYGIAIMINEGHLLVSDRAFNRVLRFNKPANGDFTNGQAASAVFGQPDFVTVSPSNSSPSAPADKMRDPRYIATDTSGRLYVADANNRRMLVFTEAASASSGSAGFIVARGLSGDLLGDVHGLWVSPSTGEIWMSGLTDSRLYRYDEYRTLSLKDPPAANLRLTTATPAMGFAIDESTGTLYVAEQGNRISIYAPPAVATDGANFVSGGYLAPAMIATIWPGSARPFSGTAAAGAAATPLPRTLADTQVLVNGAAAPLFYVSETQINFQVPNNVPQNGTLELQVLRPSTGQILAAGRVPVRPAQPRLFIKNVITSPGKRDLGQVAALNSDYSCNGPEAPPSAACAKGTRPARRGEAIMLYLTGHGYIDGLQPEGEAAPKNGIVTPMKPVIALSSGSLIDADWSGPAPDFAGLWQVNFTVPDTAQGTVSIGVSYRDQPSTVPSPLPLPVITVQ